MNPLEFISFAVAFTNVVHISSYDLGLITVRDELRAVTGYRASNGPFRASDGRIVATAVGPEAFAQIAPDGRGWQFLLPANRTNFAGFVEGSLARHLLTNAAARTNGLTPSQGIPLYSVLDNRATNFVRSTNCWLNGVTGLTAISPWNGASRDGQTVVFAVTPRHVCGAAHFQPGRTAVLFITADNEHVVRNVIDHQQIGNSDFWVGLLDADLPSSIAPLPILPDSRTNKLSTLWKGHRKVLAIGCDQTQRIFALELDGQLDVSWSRNDVWLPGWTEELVAGDSGHPVMLLIREQLVLVSHAHYANGGPDYAAWKFYVNGSLWSLSKAHGTPEYHLTEFDLTGWPDFE